MAYFRNTVTGISFIILLSIIGSAIPVTYFGGSANKVNIYLPDEFDSWIDHGNFTTISHMLNYSYDYQSVHYDFSSINPRYRDIRLVTGVSVLSVVDDAMLRRRNGDWDLDFTNMEPRLIPDVIIDNWDDNENASIVKVFDQMGYVMVRIADWNTTRNNITASMDEDYLNVTIAYLGVNSGMDEIDARDMILALLTFRLPSLYSDMSPLFGNFMSVFVYIPILMIVFTTLIKVIHG